MNTAAKIFIACILLTPAAIYAAREQPESAETPDFGAYDEHVDDRARWEAEDRPDAKPDDYPEY